MLCICCLPKTPARRAWLPTDEVWGKWLEHEGSKYFNAQIHWRVSNILDQLREVHGSFYSVLYHGFKSFTLKSTECWTSLLTEEFVHKLMALLGSGGKQEVVIVGRKWVTAIWLWSSCLVPRLLFLSVSLRLSWGKTPCLNSICHDGPSSLKAQSNQFFPLNLLLSGVLAQWQNVEYCHENRTIWKWFPYCTARQATFKHKLDCFYLNFCYSFIIIYFLQYFDFFIVLALNYYLCWLICLGYLLRFLQLLPYWNIIQTS